MSVIPTLHLKETYSKNYEINIKKENIGKLTQCSRLLDEILNRKPNQHLPYVFGSFCTADTCNPPLCEKAAAPT